MTFQEALRKARGDRPQADVAAAIGVKQSTISSWESDDADARCLPAAHRLTKVAEVYKLPAERLRKLWMAAVASRAAA
jgi:transcriptional regulator with XRE-family HTH domain